MRKGLNPVRGELMVRIPARATGFHNMYIVPKALQKWNLNAVRVVDIFVDETDFQSLLSRLVNSDSYKRCFV